MKQCPSCRTTYTDETLSFCLADGTPLIDLAEEATVIRPTGGNQMRVEIPHEMPPTNYASAPIQPEQASNTKKILLVVGLLGTMIMIAIAGAAALIYFNKDSRTAENTAVKANTNSSSPKPSPDQSNELRDQIANLEKRLDEQKKAGQSANIKLTPPNLSTMTTSAQANSPSDGFLALRSLPNSESGERIAKIPHGATVMIGACGPVIKPVNRSGRWCQAGYNGQTGWVFDAYLSY